MYHIIYPIQYTSFMYIYICAIPIHLVRPVLRSVSWKRCPLFLPIIRYKTSNQRPPHNGWNLYFTLVRDAISKTHVILKKKYNFFLVPIDSPSHRYFCANSIQLYVVTLFLNVHAYILRVLETAAKTHGHIRRRNLSVPRSKVWKNENVVNCKLWYPKIFFFHCCAY